MIAFKSLKEVLDTSIKWEKALNDFYDVAKIALKEKESRKIVGLLKQKLLDNLTILENIDIEKFGRTEWVRYASDYKTTELIPVEAIRRDSSPAEILQQILAFEEKLKSFYSSIATKLIARNQKELFESLVTFKDDQILAVHRLLENY